VHWQVARETLASLLDGEKLQLVCDNIAESEGTCSQGAQQVRLSSLQCYQQELLHILNQHLGLTKQAIRRRKRKKAQSSMQDRQHHIQK